MATLRVKTLTAISALPGHSPAERRRTCFGSDVQQAETVVTA